MQSMMRRLGPFIAVQALLLLASGWSVRAQEVRVLASVDRNTVGMDETLAYTIEIQGTGLSGITRPDPPSTEGLVLAQPFPSQSTQTSIINGQISQSIGFTWYLRPSREGSAVIASVPVTVAGRQYATETIQVQVVPHGTGTQRAPSNRIDPFSAFRTPLDNTPPEDVAPPDDRDLFIRVVPSTRSAVQNEQVTVRYELFFREGIQLRQSRLTDSWDAEGFWSEELEVDARPVPRTVVENGLRYNTITLKRAALFPTHAGDLSVDPLKIETEAVVPTRSRNPIDQLFSLRSRYVPVELESRALTLNVNPIPDVAPPGFTGAVGRYSMDVRYDRTSVPAGGSIQLVVTISGAGNLATLTAPTFEIPGAFERYDPQVALDLDRSGDILRGSKTFTYVLVARSHGQFDVPAIRFIHYDPSAGRYVTSTSDPVVITVTGNSDTLPVARATANGLPVDDIAGPMIGEVSWTRTDTTPLHRRVWPYLLLLVPAVAVGLFWYVDRRARHLAANPALGRLKQAHPLARRHLKRAGELLDAGEARSYYEEVVRALLGFVGNRLDVAEHGLTREQLGDVMTRRGIDTPLTGDLLVFLEACDLARFSPIVPPRERMEADREKAGSLFVRLDSAFRGLAT